MFNLTIPLVDYMSGVPVEGAELTIKATIYPIAYKPAVLPVPGLTSGQSPTDIKYLAKPLKELGVSSKRVQISPADGVCRFSFDLSSENAAVRNRVLAEHLVTINVCTIFEAT